MKHLMLVAALAMTGCSVIYSDGERAGTVVKFSHKGFTCKTWEGELLIGGMKSNGNNMEVNTFKFTVKDSNIIPQIKAALASGAHVTLQYDQVVMNLPCQGDSDYFIKGVK